MKKEDTGPVLKGAEVKRGGELTPDAMALINRQTLRELTADEVFTFRVAACGNEVDRDLERFTDKSLDDMAVLFVGKTVISDHKWASAGQVARVYAASVEPEAGGAKRLVLSCYLPRTEATKSVIEAIEAGILREVSVGISVKRYDCSICHKSYIGSGCPHVRGLVYDGQRCHVELDGVSDAYELSFVAVPAQPKAGVIKRYEAKEDADAGTDEPEKTGDGEDPGEKKSALQLARARLEMEKNRF